MESQQHQEWSASVGILQSEIRQDIPDEIEILRDALEESGLAAYSDVILEYDFRRRGLRIDCVLLAPGMIAVLEFKRSKLSAADADQVTNYCVNLVEFHQETRRTCDEECAIVVPVLVQTNGEFEYRGPIRGEFLSEPWAPVLREPIRCGGADLGKALRDVLGLRKGATALSREAWLSSRFSPSSSILDAAISLFGDHDVSAIHEHAGSIEQIESTIVDVAVQIEQARAGKRNTVVFVSGAPGAGKTLVGLRLAFDERFRDDAVFVTGNAPLVDVLTEALRRSYKRSASRTVGSISGYPRENARLVIENAVFKIVKAHNFLGERGKETASSDGSIVIFDEAQRTYEKGRVVVGHPLEDHEADLILHSLEQSYDEGAVVVALLGHNQAINRGERGAIAWLEAAERRGWNYAISDPSLELGEFDDLAHWRDHPLRTVLDAGHLPHSLRFYRNRFVEEWVHCVMEDDQIGARVLSERLATEGHQIWITRDLHVARSWARNHRVGDERVGLIASGQARRLAAEGLFVDQKPSIAQWMLAPSGDIRSSNMLETVQNQFQIQGLELDYTVVCWDADLRRGKAGWEAWRIRGGGWQKNKALDVAKNSYRVLLTRARKGMVVFVPEGDRSGHDGTRHPRFYDGIAMHLLACGVRKLPSEDQENEQ
ncbi:MAG: DNA/RNA helicase domain-containing protein [Myxococcota bacterium]